MVDGDQNTLRGEPTPTGASNEKVATWRAAILEAVGISVRSQQQSKDLLPATMATSSNLESAPTNGRPPRSSLRLARLALMLLILGTGYVSFFLLRLDRRYPWIAAQLPWPAAYAGGEFLTWGELHDLATMVQTPYGQLVAAPRQGADPEQQALHAWLEQRTINQALNRYHVALEPTAIQVEYQGLVQEYGDASAFEEFLNQTYRMGVAEFKAKVLTPLLQRSVLEQRLSSDELAMQQAERRARDLRRRILVGELSFAQAAARYSDDTATAEIGGNLGWFEPHSAAPELARTLGTLTVGEVSEPVRAKLGYHLLKVDEVATSGDEKGGSNLNVSHILIKPVTIDRWLDRELAQLHVVRFMPL